MEQAFGKELSSVPRIPLSQLNSMLKAFKKKSLVETEGKLARFGVDNTVKLRITPEGEGLSREESRVDPENRTGS